MINLKTPLVIYARAVGFYAVLTFPAMIFPIMYFYSLVYVLTFGWFAWALFTILYNLTTNVVFNFALRILILFISVIAAVAFAYHMIGLSGAQQDVWHSEFRIFPFAAVIVGWISVCVSRETIREAGLATS